MILITGGSGYLGGRIASYLMKLGYDVRVGTSLSSKLEGFPVDLQSNKSLDNACKGVLCIIHLAALNAQSCEKSPEKAILTNTLGTLKLLDAAKRNNVPKFLYFSTAHIYGSPLIGKIDERSLPKPAHLYSITHRTAEDFVLQELNNEKLAVSVFRLTNAVGSPINSQANCWMLIVNDLCRQVVTKKSVNVISNKYIQRDFIPITSVCKVVESFVCSRILDSETLNVSSGISTTLEDLTTLISNRSEVVLGFKPKINFVNNSTKKSHEKLYISNKKLYSLGIEVDSDLIKEVDNLLINCNKWFGDSL